MTGMLASCRHIRSIAAAGVVVAAFMFQGCSTKEGPVAPWLGERPGQGSEPLVVTVETVAKETTFAHTVSLGGGGVLFVGQDGGYRARSLVRFSTTDSSAAEFKESRIILTLHSTQDLQPVRFLLYRIEEQWTEAHVTWERATTDSLGDIFWTMSGGNLSSLPVSEAGPCSLQADTVRVAFPLAPLLTEQLFFSDEDDYGFAVVLESEGMAHGLWRMHSREQNLDIRPRWEISMIDTAGIDTTKTLYAMADAALIERISPIHEQRLLVGSGAGYRSLLEFPLPEELDSTVTINRADLFIYCDTTQMFLESPKSLLVELVDSVWVGDSTQVAAGYISQPLAVPDQSLIEVNMTLAALSWIVGLTDNYGIRLRFNAETNVVAYCPLYGSSGPPGLRPRLEITYTVPPSPPSGTGVLPSGPSVPITEKN